MDNTTRHGLDWTAARRRHSCLLVGLLWLALAPGLAADDEPGPPAAADAPPPPASSTDADPLRDIPPLTEDDYLETANCISLRRVKRTRVADANRILFYLPGGQVWLNQLKVACRGLDDQRVLVFDDLISHRVCRMDRVTVVDRLGSGAVMGRCLLGSFERITAAQAEGLMAQPAATDRPGLLSRIFRRKADD